MYFMCRFAIATERWEGPIAQLTIECICVLCNMHYIDKLSLDGYGNDRLGLMTFYSLLCVMTLVFPSHSMPTDTPV